MGSVNGYEDNERVVYVIENVFFEFAQLNLRVGDIFLTPQCFHYVPYSEYLSHGGIGVGVASFLGGVVGGIAASATEKERRDGALKHCEKQRRIQWGMNMSERLRRNNEVLTFGRRRISDLSVQDTLSFADGSTSFEFGVPDLSAHSETLREWLGGSLTADQKSCVVTGKRKAPQLVLEDIQARDAAQLSSAELELLVADEDYMVRMWELVAYLSAKDRRAILAKVEQIGGPFRDKVVSLRQSTATSGKKNLAVGLGMLAVGGFLLVPMVLPVLQGHGDEPASMWVGLRGAVGFVLVLTGINSMWKWYKTTRY